MCDNSAVIIGAGPAGLTAAYELARRGIKPFVYEKSANVGGLARTEEYRGFRFDIGPHRFFTKVEEIEKLWVQMLGPEFRKVKRLSRIYHRQRYFSYPLSISNVLRNLGLLEGFLIFASYCNVWLRPRIKEESFEQWVTNRFGYRLYSTFFKTYTEKVWGIPCSEIRADWAAQRIKGLSLIKAVAEALFSRGDAKSLIREFYYPRLGAGQMWEAFREKVERLGGSVVLESPVVRLYRENYRVLAVTVSAAAPPRTIRGEHFVSSMPVSQLISILDPAAPEEVVAASSALKYRDFIIVMLIFNCKDVFPDNWIYVHSSEVRVSRIHNFKNWSPDMVPDPNKTALGLEYFCSRDDDLWNRSNAELIELGTREIEQLGLAELRLIEDARVIRQPMAYPVYDSDYRRHLEVIKTFLSRFENLQTIGRNGMHRYNNQDHAMLCGLYAARNLLGANHDLWEINTERSYHEEYELTRKPPLCDTTDV